MSSVMPNTLRSYSKTSLAAGSALLTVVLLSGCSSVPNAINPVHWYDSLFAADDEVAPIQSSRPVARGLSADRSNAHYTQEALNREGSPTRPLNPELAVAKAAPHVTPGQGADSAQPQQAAADNAVVTSDAAPPPPAPVVSQETTPVVPAPAPVQAESAAAVEPAPSQEVAAAPVLTPPPPAAKAPVGPESVEETYMRRLNEFAAPPVQPSAFQSSFQSVNLHPVGAGSSSRAPVLTPPSLSGYAQTVTANSSSSSQLAYAGSSQGQVIHLIPPGRAKAVQTAAARNASGARSLADFSDSNSVASFDLGNLRFGEGTIELSAADKDNLRNIANLYRQKGGTLRVIAASSSSRLDVDPMANRDANRVLAHTRADAIAAELIRMGVPARKIFAGAAVDASQVAGADGAEILLDM